MPTYHTTFISHAHADNDLVADYAARLRARGINLWLDLTNAQRGHDLPGEINTQLEQRSALLLIVTKASNESRWVALEVSNFITLYADKGTYLVNGVERIIVPVLIENVPIPGRLRSFIGINAVGRARDDVVDEIVRFLQIQLAHGPTVQPPPPPLTPQRASYPILARLDSLGFEGWRDAQGTPYIVPPVCAVPAGKFTMGSAQDDTEAFDQEKPQYRIDVAAFEIGAYPVTVAEYALAVQAGAVPAPQEPSNKNFTWAAQQGRPDHPVVCVTWENARDYGRWLAQRTGQPWRLPTEAEWEKAARWDATRNHARIYPWGDQWDKMRANISDGGPGLTTPVGTYNSRGDASTCGAHDMAGNVWEWISTLWYDKPPYDASQYEKDADTSTKRVLRGGSWNNSPRFARAAYRARYVRSGWSNDGGFRVARAGGLVK